MTELYTMMRYLQHDAIRGKGLAHFDCWASTFGETQTAIELAPEGTGYRARTRFAKFFNLPELMTLFKEAADIKTSDQLNLPTPTPIYHNEVAQPTEIQKQMVQELSERAARVHAQLVDPGTGASWGLTSASSTPTCRTPRAARSICAWTTSTASGRTGRRTG